MLRCRFKPKGSKEEPIKVHAHSAAEPGDAVKQRTAQDLIEQVMLS